MKNTTPDSLIFEIQNLLKDFKPISNKTQKNKKKLVKIQYNEIPINPSLMSYCFDNILGFVVKYKIFEKINYIIDFDYKGTYASVAEYKLSYFILINKNFKNEILEIFSKIKIILEQLFILKSQECISANKFTMESRQFYYDQKFMFYEKNIYKIKLKIKKNEHEYHLSSKSKDMIKDKFKSFNRHNLEIYKLTMEQLYSIETYIETFFSYLEHILVLLYPFSDNFNIKKPYIKSYIFSSESNLYTKIIDVLGNTKDILKLIEYLKEIKTIHRNRLTHGMFSKELKINIFIEKFGAYPLYVGKNYLKGFTDKFDLKLDYEKFLKYKKTFHRILKRINLKYEIPMELIKNDISIPVDVSWYKQNIKTKSDVEKYISYIDDQRNMDW